MEFRMFHDDPSDFHLRIKTAILLAILVRRSLVFLISRAKWTAMFQPLVVKIYALKMLKGVMQGKKELCLAGS
ncbi:hypothetical protein QQ045_022493 [Rhodiola kirilowii]